MEIVALSKETMHLLTQLDQVRDLVVQQNHVEAFMSDRKNIAFFALDHEQVVGFIFGYVLDRLESNPMLFIYSLDVIESYRRLGIGRRLVEEFLLLMKKEQYQKVFLITGKENGAANALYRSFDPDVSLEQILYLYK